MMLMRKCDGCKQPIPQAKFVEVSIRILDAEKGESQDPIEQSFGDYCDRCVASGDAIEDLVSELKKYHGLEAVSRNRQPRGKYGNRI